jgi:RNA polymerase sigma-70 factor (ECF subfamily)
MTIRREAKELTDREWAGALQRREAWAWERLHQQTLEPVFAYVHRHCRRREDAEDITAEVYAAAVASIDRFRGEASILTWLIGIARRKLVDAARRRGRHPELLETDLTDGAMDAVALSGIPEAERAGPEHPEAALERRETAAGMRREVMALPDAQREALLLRCVEELSLSEIAQVLGRSENAVKGLLRRAKTALQERLGAEARAERTSSHKEPQDGEPLPSIP